MGYRRRSWGWRTRWGDNSPRSQGDTAGLLFGVYLFVALVVGSLAGSPLIGLLVATVLGGLNVWVVYRFPPDRRR